MADKRVRVEVKLTTTQTRHWKAGSLPALCKMQGDRFSGDVYSHWMSGWRSEETGASGKRLEPVLEVG
jgi:hypothetical protein